MRPTLMALVTVFLVQDSLLGQIDMSGLALSLRAHGASWKLDELEGAEFDSHTGVGAGAEVFYGMSDIFGVFGRIDLSSMSSDQDERYTLTHFDIGVRLLPSLASRSVRPYAELAFAARSAEFNVGALSLEVSGPGGTVGAGLLVGIGPRLAAVLGASGTFGNLEEVTLGNFRIDTSVKATSWRGSAGLIWFP